MLKSIIGTKIGMTQIFDNVGNLLPVTVIEAGPCIVTGIKTKENDGYSAVQLGYRDLEEKLLNKPLLGQFKKNNIANKKYLKEFRVEDVSNYKIGQEIKIDIFQPGQYVDVSGVSKGKGFAGTVKRYGFSGGVTTHGQSDRQRAPGSSGGQQPQRVIKGKRKPGHLGVQNVTVQKLKVVSVDPNKNVILVEGAVPGVKDGMLVIKDSVKKVKKHVEHHAEKKKSKK